MNFNYASQSYTHKVKIYKLVTRNSYTKYPTTLHPCFTTWVTLNYIRLTVRYNAYSIILFSIWWVSFWPANAVVAGVWAALLHGRGPAWSVQAIIYNYYLTATLFIYFYYKLFSHITSTIYISQNYLSLFSIGVNN